MNRNDLNITSGTNWEALESRSEENIDYSDIPPLTDDFFERSTLRIPAEGIRGSQGEQNFLGF